MPQFLTPIDLTKQELRNARIQNLASAPSSPVSGQVYFDTILSVQRAWNGTGWINADGSNLPDNTITSAKITDGAIVNADINASAAIAKTKLAALDIINADINASAAIAKTKLAALAIVNADVAAGAAIALSKLATDPLARANHTGTQSSSTISDFDTQVRVSTLNQMAAPTTSVGFNNQKITGLLAGTASTDATNFQQLQDAKNNIDRKDSVRVAAMADVTIAGPGANVDGIAMVAGQSFLAAGQTTSSQNGIYVWNGSAVAATRRVDADSNADVTAGLTTVVEEGTQADKRAILITNNPIDLGVTALAFTFETTGETILGGAGLLKTGSTLDVGAGTGITVGVDTVAVDTAIVTRKVNAQIGDGVALAYAVAHNLGNQWVTVQVVRNSAPFDVVGIDPELTDANTVTVRFAVAPTANQYRVIVQG